MPSWSRACTCTSRPRPNATQPLYGISLTLRPLPCPLSLPCPKQYSSKAREGVEGAKENAKGAWEGAKATAQGAAAEAKQVGQG